MRPVEGSAPSCETSCDSSILGVLPGPARRSARIGRSLLCAAAPGPPSSIATFQEGGALLVRSRRYAMTEMVDWAKQVQEHYSVPRSHRPRRLTLKALCSTNQGCRHLSATLGQCTMTRRNPERIVQVVPVL